MNILAPITGSTANSILLNIATLTNNKKYSFKATSTSTGNVTINGKAFKKLDGTQIGNGGIKANKVYDFYYDGTTDCVFILAKAVGTATVADVLAPKTFSNGEDIELTGGIPSKAAATYTPATTDQTIAANQYLSGIQTIKGDSNLVGGNIKKGVTLFNVPGTYDPLTLIEGTTTVLINEIPGKQTQNAGANNPVLIRNLTNMNYGGTVIVTFTLSYLFARDTVYARIYVNNISRGIIRSATEPMSFTETITINKGDTIQIYGWSTNDWIVISNLKITCGNVLPYFI